MQTGLPGGIILDYDMEFYYTYVLLSLKDNKLYYGFTNNLKLRIKQHSNGEVKSTKYRRPLELIYFEACFEACLNKQDAIRREKYFKTYYGRMFLNKRLKNYFNLLNSYLSGEI